MEKISDMHSITNIFIGDNANISGSVQINLAPPRSDLGLYRADRGQDRSPITMPKGFRIVSERDWLRAICSQRILQEQRDEERRHAVMNPESGASGVHRADDYVPAMPRRTRSLTPLQQGLLISQ